MAVEQADTGAAVQQYIMHHVTASHEWSLPFVRLELPGPLTNHAIMLFMGGLILVALFGLFYRRGALVPHGLSNLLEVFVLFIRDQIAIPSLGDADGRKLTPLFCSFFFFILCFNLMGLFPAFSSATGDISVTAALAVVTLGFMIFGGIYKNGLLGFIKCFLPHGVPVPLLFLLGPIEFIGLIVRSAALAIRLFANMLAGHIVIFALLGLVVMFGWVALPAVILTIGIYFLEMFICFLQAYIFTLLSAIFMGQLYHPEH